MSTSDKSNQSWLHQNRVFLAIIALIVVGTIILSIMNSSNHSAQKSTYTPSAKSLPAADANKVAGDVDYGPYMAAIQRNIKRQWYPPKRNRSLRAVLIFKVWPDGHVTNLRLEKPTGDKAMDQAAFEAVHNAEPFPHLPGGVKEPVDIEFTLDYNAKNY